MNKLKNWLKIIKPKDKKISINEHEVLAQRIEQVRKQNQTDYAKKNQDKIDFEWNQKFNFLRFGGLIEYLGIQMTVVLIKRPPANNYNYSVGQIFCEYVDKTGKIQSKVFSGYEAYLISIL